MEKRQGKRTEKVERQGVLHMMILQSVIQLYDLNLELLDVLTTTLSWIQKYCDEHNIPLRNEDSLYRLITLSRKVMKEMDAAEINLAKSFFFSSDESKQRKRPDGEVTEPSVIIF